MYLCVYIYIYIICVEILLKSNFEIVYLIRYLTMRKIKCYQYILLV